MDSIWAQASGKGIAGIAIIRLSGPAVRVVVETMCGRVPPPNQAELRSIRKRDGEVIDRGLVLFFEGPKSFTGEDVVEFHVHGGRAISAALGSEFARFPDLRPAEPGEFARRAFLNGKMDLTEVEGLADLLAAETEVQRRQALAQSGGVLRTLYDGWRQRLVRARAFLEADLDFAEEEDIPGSVADGAFEEIGSLIAEIDSHLKGSLRGERTRDGYQIVLLGAPNAGKSSLLNALARRDVAIVTDEAGTTRDLLEVHLDLGGYPVTVVDTAGLREGGGAVEREGMRRAVQRGSRADLVLRLVARDDPAEGDGTSFPDFECPVWWIDSKADLAACANGTRGGDGPCFSLSVKSGKGIEALLDAIETQLEIDIGNFGATYPSRERHALELNRCRDDLQAALIERPLGLEIVAERLRSAGDHVGRLTGAIGVEEILGEIFSSFCVGK